MAKPHKERRSTTVVENLMLLKRPLKTLKWAVEAGGRLWKVSQKKRRRMKMAWIWRWMGSSKKMTLILRGINCYTMVMEGMIL